MCCSSLHQSIYTPKRFTPQDTSSIGVISQPEEHSNFLFADEMNSHAMTLPKIKKIGISFISGTRTKNKAPSPSSSHPMHYEKTQIVHICNASSDIFFQVIFPPSNLSYSMLAMLAVVFGRSTCPPVFGLHMLLQFVQPVGRVSAFRAGPWTQPLAFPHVPTAALRVLEHLATHGTRVCATSTSPVWTVTWTPAQQV